MLAEIERGAALRVLPAVVLSGSAQREERILSCEMGANACVPKPAQLGRYRAMVRATCEFWCGAALSPLRP